MRTVWQVFLRDCRRILRNPVAVVVTLGVAMLPSLYAWFNILANWDPYSATGNLQVAVANEDQGTTNDLVGHLDAGRQVVKKLKQNDELGWRFVDNEEQAVHGVETGGYYAAIVLPKDFSTSLVESVTGTSKQPKIKYYVNEKKNAIAPKITDTGATTIDEQINSAFVTTVATTVASAISETGDDLGQATGKVQHDTIDDLNTVMSTLNTVQDSLTDLQDTLAQSDTILADAKQTTASLKQTVAAAQNASRQSGTLLAETQAGSQAFSTTLVGALDSSSAQLSGLAVHVNNAAGSITGSFNSAQNSVDTITNTLSAPLNATQTSISDLKDALTKAGIGKDTTDPVGQNIWKQIDALDSLISKQQTQLNTFHTDTTQFINSGKDATTNLSGAMTNTTTGGIAALNTARGSLTGTVMPSLTSSLNSFAALNGTLDGTLTSLSGTLDQADGLFDQLVDTLNQTKTTISSTQDSLRQVASDVATVRTDIATLDSSAAYQKIRDTLHLDDKGFGDFMGNPVTLTTKVVYATDNYGSAVTPFYTNLALWVGGFVLIAIYKLEVDREGIRRITATQAYLGRWLLLVTIGFLQAVIATIGDLVLGIQCEHPLLFILAGIFCSFVYINIIYALAVAFRHIGKAIAVILVIVQIPGASGLYPIEMMPNFFRELHPWLPFTYGINLLRETVGGMYSFNYLFNLCILGVFLIVALFIGLQLRPLLLNLNLLFDKQLSTTGMMICESNDLPRQRYSLRTAMRVMLDSDSYRHELLDHAVAFEHRYPYYIKGGFAAVVGVQVLLFVLSTVLDIDNNGKIILLVIWIISVIAICGWLINIEYIRASLNTQMRISALSDEDLRREMREHTAAIPAARHMFGLNASERGAKGGDQSAGRLPHIGSPHKSQGSDSTATNDGDTTALGKHSKGGEA